MQDTLPKKLGKYSITRVLGRGAMGVVYEGMDPGIERRVAIKTIHRNLLEGDGSQELLARFKREAQAAGRLMHHNIVAIYEYGEELGIPFIAMEFVEGKELKDYIAEQARFELSQIVDIMTQTLSAMSYVHAAGVVHRDMKPANIILMDNGHVKLADFGIARMKDSSMTQIGAVMGTPSYMSPEQFMGQRSDKRADLFSVGVILYDLLTGEKPFPGRSMATIMQKVLYAPVDPPTTYNLDLPNAFDAVIAKALAKAPKDRFQCAEDFLQAIKLAAEDRYAPTLKPIVSQLPDPDATAIVRTKEQPIDGKEKAKETFLTMLETAYEFAPNSKLSVSSRVKLKAKAVALGLSAEDAASLNARVASRFGAPLEENVATTEPTPVSAGPSPKVSASKAPSGKSATLPKALSATLTDDRVGRTSSPATPGSWLMDNENGTVTDMRNGLISLKDLSCYDEHTWQEALEAVAKLAHGSYGLEDDSIPGSWRLPTKDELPILIEWKKTGVFIGVQSSYDTAQKEIPKASGGMFKMFRPAQEKTRTFSHFREPGYWSNTGSDYTTKASSAWNISLFNGKISLYGSKNLLNVWPIRLDPKHGSSDN